MKFLTQLILSLPFVGAYALFAVGIVVIYRASRVLNLAHGAMAMVPSYVTFSLVQGHIPMFFAVILGIASGAGLGVVVERVFVRGLRHMSLTAQTVGTVGVLALLMAVAAKVWGTAPRKAPEVFGAGHIVVGSGILRYGAIGLFVVSVVLALAMLALFRYTGLGLAMRGAAVNRRAASLMGIDPDRTTAIAWALGGGLAAISGILLAAITTLHPYQLPLQTLPAFVGALIGGLESMGGALAGAGVVGVLLGMVPATVTLPGIGGLTAQSGSAELMLTIAALVIMVLRGQRFVGATRDDAGFTTRGAAAAARSRRRGVVPLPLGVLMFGALLAWVWIPGVPFSILANVSQALVFTIVGVSLVVLTGWVGQISLGHAALVGIGAFGTGIFARELGISFPFNLPLAMALSAGAAVMLGAVALRVRGLYLAVATLIFSWMADSFLFRTSWFVGTGGTSTIKNTTFGSPGGFPNFDLSDRKILYYFGLAVAGMAVLAAANIRGSKTGRAFFATRGSEVAAASLGIDVMRYKLLAFGFAGLLAGAAGNLIMIDQRTVGPDQFAFSVSLFYLAIVVVGGLTSLTGVVFSAILFASLNELFFRVSALGGYLEVVSAGLLVAALLTQARSRALGAFWTRLDTSLRRLRASMAPVAARVGRAIVAPLAVFARPVGAVAMRLPRRRRAATAVQADGGTGERPQGAIAQPTGNGDRPQVRGARKAPAPRVTGRLRAFAEGVQRMMRRRPTMVVTADEAFVVASDGEPDGDGSRGRLKEIAETRSAARVVLEGSNITVRFGGLTAVDDATLEIREGEIVGLIGPNGAGKTTLFNALSGLNEPTTGRVALFGSDVSSSPVHERARLGLGRTFQVLQLFADLTVRENLLVATHVHNQTGVLRHVFATDMAVRAEREAHERVQETIDALELHDLADRPVAGLPFGTLRLVELGRAVVTEAAMILLDEPASGLDNNETDSFAQFLRSLRDRFGISMLLIEHDVRMVTGVSDYMYVLNTGRIIARGSPDQIRRNPAVVAAYLGEPATAPVPAGV